MRFSRTFVLLFAIVYTFAAPVPAPTHGSGSHVLKHHSQKHIGHSTDSADAHRHPPPSHHSEEEHAAHHPQAQRLARRTGGHKGTCHHHYRSPSHHSGEEEHAPSQQHLARRAGGDKGKRVNTAARVAAKVKKVFSSNPFKKSGDKGKGPAATPSHAGHSKTQQAASSQRAASSHGRVTPPQQLRRASTVPNLKHQSTSSSSSGSTYGENRKSVVLGGLSPMPPRRAQTQPHAGGSHSRSSSKSGLKTGWYGSEPGSSASSTKSG